MSEYLKPQSPLYHKAEDAYFYPLTTVDQVVLEDGSRLNTELSKHLMVDVNDVNEGDTNSVNADTLGGYAADEYVRKDQYGIELNYSVVGSMEEPGTPTQNMIWIQTETPIGRVFFGNDEPNETFMEGDVWIYTDINSNAAFNSLKIGNSYINMVYPLRVKQYISGSWVNETSMIYQNSEWREVFTKTLFSNGKDYEYVTGGWYAENDGTQLVFTIPIVSSNSKKFYTNKKSVYLTNHKAVTIEVNSTSEDTSTWCLGIFDKPVNGEDVEPVVKKEDAYMKAGEHVLDVSALSGRYYIGVGINRNVSSDTNKVNNMCIGTVTME